MCLINNIVIFNNSLRRMQIGTVFRNRGSITKIFLSLIRIATINPCTSSIIFIKMFAKFFIPLINCFTGGSQIIISS